MEIIRDVSSPNRPETSGKTDIDSDVKGIIVWRSVCPENRKGCSDSSRMEGDMETFLGDFD